MAPSRSRPAPLWCRRLGVLAVAGLLGAQAVTARTFDNVLLISIDTLRADHVGCYGAAAPTPTIDRLAARGVRFAVAVAPTPLTLPSHASLLTGLGPPRHGLRDNSGFRLAGEITTLAEVFAGQGFATGAFVSGLPLDSRFGLDQGFAAYDDTLSIAPEGGVAAAERPADEVTSVALDWLRGRTGGRWFAWVHYYDPHFPYRPPERFRGGSPAANYRGEVAYVDEQVGRLLAFLEASGQTAGTLVVVTADHGESLGEHAEQSHGVFAYESTLRVPLVLAPLPPRVVAQRVRLIDVAPTLLDLLGLSFPDAVDGTSLRPVLEGRPQPSPPSYFEALAMYLNEAWAPLRGFYSERFQYVELPQPELYDLDADPGERHNLCLEESCDDWARRFRDFAGEFSPVAPSERVDDEMARKLAALGYVGGGGGGGAGRRFGPGDDPKNLIALQNRLNLALERAAQGQPERALALLADIVRERPSMSAAYLRAAALQRQLGRPQQAVVVLEQALRNGAGNLFVERELGLALRDAGRLTEAIERLRSALREAPDNIDLLDALGLAYLDAGQAARAEEVLRRAVTVDPSSTSSRTHLGTLYLMNERWREAAEQYSAALAVAPDLAEAHAGMGFAYSGSDQLELASAAFESALELDRAHLDWVLNLAVTYLDRGLPARAVPLLEEFIAGADPKTSADQLALARALLERSRQP